MTLWFGSKAVGAMMNLDSVVVGELRRWVPCTEGLFSPEDTGAVGFCCVAVDAEGITFRCRLCARMEFVKLDPLLIFSLIFLRADGVKEVFPV
jgi:hypothetical protein